MTKKTTGNKRKTHRKKVGDEETRKRTRNTKKSRRNGKVR